MTTALCARATLRGRWLERAEEAGDVLDVEHRDHADEPLEGELLAEGLDHGLGCGRVVAGVEQHRRLRAPLRGGRARSSTRSPREPRRRRAGPVRRRGTLRRRPVRRRCAPDVHRAAEEDVFVDAAQALERQHLSADCELALQDAELQSFAGEPDVVLDGGAHQDLGGGQRLLGHDPDGAGLEVPAFSAAISSMVAE